ncbi:hypothetical protein PsYK624_119580 [Phanerochaete sordida]|uniref:Uncharacterized protein n=1 Tax=Phanerochaete sordida TaxID=48140 RepID=A0A9P3LHQ3_9APHY|nr:hypothetical protein PsYK624_119580 [Phanerochaete sordida]
MELERVNHDKNVIRLRSRRCLNVSSGEACIWKHVCAFLLSTRVKFPPFSKKHYSSSPYPAPSARYPQWECIHAWRCHACEYEEVEISLDLKQADNTAAADIAAADALLTFL